MIVKLQAPPPFHLHFTQTGITLGHIQQGAIAMKKFVSLTTVLVALAILSACGYI